MSRVEVLVACMHKKDDTLYSEMNLQTDAVLANQADEYSYTEYKEKNGCTAKLVTTADRGVGKNRNKALLVASGEYLVFADEDMIYEPGYEDMVLDAFDKAKNADIIAFNLTYLNRFTPGRRPGKKFKRIHFWNSMRYGAARIAIRRSALERASLSFSHLYGGGAKYSSGEDSLFIREALRRGLKMYYCPVAIATVKQEESSWFRGYNDKFFTDKGVLIANAFPILKGVLIYYFAFKMRKLSKDYNQRKIRRLMREGFRVFREL